MPTLNIYYFYFLIAIAAGCGITVLFQKLRPFIQDKLTGLSKLIKTYAFISAIILLISIILHGLNLFLVTADKKAFFEILINFYTTLGFAIFTGYVAFRQFQLNMFDKYSEQAQDHFESRRYKRAERLFKDAYAINPNDYDIVANFAEFSLIVQKVDIFKALLRQLKEICVEDDELIVLAYLRIANFLLQEDIGSAKRELKDLIRIIRQNPNSLENFSWSFVELKDSDVYSSISGESKILLDNLIKLLEKKMAPKEKETFCLEYNGGL